MAARYKLLLALLMMLGLMLLSVTLVDARAETLDIAIDKDFRHTAVGQGVDYLTLADDVTVDWALLSARDDWQHSRQTRVMLGMQDGTFLFRFKLSNRSNRDLTLLLAVENPLIDYIEMTQWDNGIKVDRQQLGDLLPFAQRLIEHETLLFPITLKAAQNSEIVLKVANEGLFYLPLQLWQEGVYIEHNSKTSLLQGLFFGFLSATIFSCFLLYLISWIRKFALLGIAICIEIFTLMTLWGIGNRFFWPDWPWLQQHVTLVLMVSTLIAAALFGLALLNVRLHNISMLRWSKGLIAVGGILTLLSLFLAVDVATVILLLYAAFLALSMLAIGIWCWRRRVNAAELYTISWAVTTISFLTVTLWGGLNIILWVEPLELFIVNALISTVLLFIALIRQYIGDKAEQITAQQRAIVEISSHEKMQQKMLAVEEKSREELELKIQERTFELEVTLRELEESNRELEQKNTQDALTGIRNRRYFDKKYLAEFRRSRREQTELSVVMIDIDHFKAVNDNHGHLAGDDVIRFVGRSIKDMLRRIADDVCRYGGEEFALILPSTSEDGARQLAQSICENIAKTLIETHNGNLSVTISCGICTGIVHNELAQNHYVLMADKALYAAKQQGRNRVIHCQDLADADSATDAEGGDPALFKDPLKN